SVGLCGWTGLMGLALLFVPSVNRDVGLLRRRPHGNRRRSPKKCTVAGRELGLDRPKQFDKPNVMHALPAHSIFPVMQRHGMFSWALHPIVPPILPARCYPEIILLVERS